MVYLFSILASITIRRLCYPPEERTLVDYVGSTMLGLFFILLINLVTFSSYNT